MMARLAVGVLGVILLFALGQCAWRAVTGHGLGTQGSAPATATVPVSPPDRAVSAAVGSAGGAQSLVAPPAFTAPAAAAPSSCGAGEGFAQAAIQNAASLDTAPVAPFGRAEIGWEVYLPLTAQEIGAACPPQSPRLRPGPGRVAEGPWPCGQRRDGCAHPRRPEAGLAAPAALRGRLGHGVCPPAPTPDRLAWTTAKEAYGGKPVQLRTGAVNAYRAMASAARRDIPALTAEPALLTIFSGYRDPIADAVRCVTDGNCGGPVRANCSAHRTGLAMDIDLGAAPGYRVDSAADPNRLYMSRSPAYRWLVANAGRFGFVNYPFEPWHWEWTGETP